MTRNNNKNLQLLALIIRLLIKKPLLLLCVLIFAVGGYFYLHQSKAVKAVKPAPVIELVQPTTTATPVKQSEAEISFQGQPKSQALISFSTSSEVLQNQAFTVGYSNKRGNPLWVVYKIKSVPTDTAHLERASHFSTDKRVENQVKQSDYNKSGYDRGHMAPNYAISALYGKEAQLETFLMTNITPQKPNLNRKLWQRLESAEISFFTQLAPTVWVTTGTVFDDKIETLKTAHNVEIPDAFYKLYAMQAGGKTYLLAFLIPQTVKGNEPLDRYVVSVDKIEQLTGLDFFHELDDREENALEAAVNPDAWKLSEVSNLPSRY